MEGADSSRNGRDVMVTNPGDGHSIWSWSSPTGWIESTVKSAFTWCKRFRAMVALMRTWSASRKETMTRVATAVPLWKMQSTHSLSLTGGARKGRLSVGQWAHNSLLTRWCLSCSTLNRYGCLSSHSSPWWWRRGSSMGVQSAATTGASRIFLFLSWLARLVGQPNGRVPADGSPGGTDDGRVIRDFKLEPTAREV